MSRFGQVDLNKTQDEERWLTCLKCDDDTSHKVLVSVNVTEEGDPFNFYTGYEVVQCQGCKTISFRKNWKTDDDIGYDPFTGKEFLVDHEEVYPGRIAGRPKLKDYEHLPKQIIGIYNETHIALCNKLSVLAGVGIRALIEAVCKDKSAKGSKLEEKIADLVAMGVLTKEGADILHRLRVMGNQAAHEATPHSATDLNTAFDVVEHLLKGVYILPPKAKKLPKGNVSP